MTTHTAAKNAAINSPAAIVQPRASLGAHVTEPCGASSGAAFGRVGGVRLGLGLVMVEVGGGQSAVPSAGRV